MAQVWLHGFPIPRRTVELAVAAEGWGFDGLLLADSQNLVGDPYVELALAAAATSRLRLGPAVTNVITRHPAVTAAAVATLQVESDGRAALVLGRGDSAVVQLGERPATTAHLEQGLVQVRGLLRGASVQLASGGQARLGWFAAEGAADVHVAVAATGPRTIALAARHADEVSLSVGADLEQVSSAVATARRALAAGTSRTGSTPAPTLGAFINFAVHPDRTVARDLVRGSAAIFAHFVSEGPIDAMAAEDRAVLTGLHSGYREAGHGLSTADHATALPDDFLDRFAVAGPAQDCVRRLREIIGLGIDRLIMVPGSRDADPDLVHESNARFARDVLPALRAG